jgi:aldose 1-epimerase
LAGFCLECQGYPDGANHPELGDIILRPDDIYRQTTIYRFSTE